MHILVRYRKTIYNKGQKSLDFLSFLKSIHLFIALKLSFLFFCLFGFFSPLWDGIVIQKSCIKIVELPITPSLYVIVRLNSEIFTSLMWINNEHGEQGGENHSKNEPEWFNTLNPDCSVTQRYVYQENAFKKSKNLSPFFFFFFFFFWLQNYRI